MASWWAFIWNTLTGIGDSLARSSRAGPVWGCRSINPRRPRKADGGLVLLVGVPGFEPGTSCSQSRRATGLRHTPSLPANNLDDRDRLAKQCPIPYGPTVTIL